MEMETALVIGSSDEEPQSSESATSSPEPTPNPTPNPTFVIEVRPPTKYTPGCGPALQPLRLLPPATPGAYVIERILLPSPGLAADGRPLPKRMMYIVGWHDLPAASLLVPAMDILDYVSPRALEDWEETLEEELDRERIKLAEEEKEIGFKGLKQKHKARPPTHTDIEPAAAIEPETQADHVVRPKMGAMSLSTPQKRKLADFEGLSDNENSTPNQFASEISERDSREDSWDMPSAGATNEDMLVEFAKDTVNRDGAQRSKRPNINTPVPLPSYINGMLGYETLSIEPGQAAAAAPAPTPIFTADNASRHPGPADLVASIERTASSSAAGLDAFTGSLSLPNTYESAGGTPAARQAASSTNKSTPHQSSKKRRKETPPIDEIGEDGEPTWEVERVEDMALYDVEGQGLVRYFLVRWAGDWPPDQQTSWEPEYNLPRNLIRSFTKMDKKRRAKLAAQNRCQRKPSDEDGWGSANAAYSSVEELAQAEDQGGDLLADAPQAIGEEGSLFVEHDVDRDVFVIEDESETRGDFQEGASAALPPVFGVY